MGRRESDLRCRVRRPQGQMEGRRWQRQRRLLTIWRRQGLVERKVPQLHLFGSSVTALCFLQWVPIFFEGWVALGRPALSAAAALAETGDAEARAGRIDSLELSAPSTC